MKRILILCLIALLSMVLVACGETTTPEKVDKAAEQPAPEPAPPQQEIFAIGDTVKMGDLEFTVHGARWDKGDDFAKPEAGQKWLVINATIKNNHASDSAAISSMLMLELVDDEHYTQEWNIWANTKGSLDGELGAGRSMRGEMAYTVSADAKSFEFIFAPNVFGTGQAIFAFGADEVE